jgi:hypothetical protein
MAPSDELREGVAAANELYWGSERSVNQIAEELDLSKSVLYGMITPLPLGLACPECAEEVVSPNRTARDRGVLKCLACEWEGPEAETAPLGGADPTPSVPAERRGMRLMSRINAARARTMAGGALLGAAVGLAWVLWARRR